MESRDKVTVTFSLFLFFLLCVIASTTGQESFNPTVKKWGFLPPEETMMVPGSLLTCNVCNMSNEGLTPDPHLNYFPLRARPSSRIEEGQPEDWMHGWGWGASTSQESHDIFDGGGIIGLVGLFGLAGLIVLPLFPFFLLFLISPLSLIPLSLLLLPIPLLIIWVPPTTPTTPTTTTTTTTTTEPPPDPTTMLIGRVMMDDGLEEEAVEYEVENLETGGMVSWMKK